MVSGGITMDCCYKSEYLQMWNLQHESKHYVLYVQCGKWIHTMCLGVKRSTSTFL